MIEHLSERSEPEVAQETRQPRSGGRKVDVMRHSRLPMERHAGMFGIELPRMQIEHSRAAVPFGFADVRTRQPIWVDAKVGAAAGREIPAREASNRQRKLDDAAGGGRN